MYFGHPVISPPLFCYYIIPPYPCLSQEINFTNFPAEEHQDEKKLVEENKIIVNEEDLIEGGYEQNKKAWT